MFEKHKISVEFGAWNTGMAMWKLRASFGSPTASLQLAPGRLVPCFLAAICPGTSGANEDSIHID